MPIILAIEPDRRQAAHLTALVHRRVKAELILVPTTAGALDAIGNRVPDLVLIPALLAPQDDAALAAALRVIAAAARVQMLTIPVLGPPRPAAKAGGVLSALRRDKSRSAEPDGCDPAVFAEQIASYLERAAEERATTVTEMAVTETTVTETTVTELVHDEAPAADEFAMVASEAEKAVEDVSEWTQEEPAADESVSFALEEVARALFSDARPAPEPPADVFVADVEAAAPPLTAMEIVTEIPLVAAAVESIDDADAEWASVEHLMSALQLMPLVAIEATQEDEWIAPIGDPVRVTERAQIVPDAVANPDVPAPSARSEQEWVALVESLRHDVERIRTERADKPAPRPAPAQSSRSRKAKPVQDEWGLFDPEQCGFAALLAKLEEVTEEEKSRS